MPRPKGSKSRPALTLEEQIVRVTAEIEFLRVRIKEKKCEPKKLNAEMANEDKNRLMDVILAGGKSVDEIIPMIDGAEP